MGAAQLAFGTSCPVAMPFPDTTANCGEARPGPQPHKRRWWPRRFTLYLLALAIFALPGCRGCRDDKQLTQEEMEAKLLEEKKKKKEPSSPGTAP